MCCKNRFFGDEILFIKLVFLFSGPLIGKQNIIKPLRSLRLCGEKIYLDENPDTYLTAQLEFLYIFRYFVTS
jgi:hypothetical protein